MRGRFRAAALFRSRDFTFVQIPGKLKEMNKYEINKFQ